MFLAEILRFVKNKSIKLLTNVVRTRENILKERLRVDADLTDDALGLRQLVCSTYQCIMGWVDKFEYFIIYFCR